MTWRPLPTKAVFSPHLRRYGWFRLFSDFPTHAKWRVVAKRTALPIHQVLAVAVTLLCKANVGRPRGSLAEFSILECAAALDMPDEHIARIYAALEELGWIDQEYLTTWDERQPDKEDPGAAERQRRRRAKIRGERVPETLSTGCHGVTGVTLRDITPRPDQTQQERGLSERDTGERVTLMTSAADSPVHSETGDNGDNLTPTEAAEVWLATEGKRIVVERLMTNTTLAGVRMKRWRAELGDDAVALAEVLQAADKADYVGARFHNLVVDQVKRRRHQANGPSLPLLPPRPRSRAFEG